MRGNLCDISVPSEVHARIMAHLYPGDGDEHGAVLHAGVVRSGDSLRLLVRHVEIAEFGCDYVVGNHGYRALDPRFIHRQIIQCRDAGLAYLAIHNHPSDRKVSFSRIDLESHERGYPALLDIGRGVPIGALVYGQHSVEADIWLPDRSRRSLGTYRIIGQRVRRLYSQPSVDSESLPEHDRQIRMFGAEGQHILFRSKVAVVGLGGIGSLVAEYLARLGVGHLVFVDPDEVESSNLSRVVGATRVDVETKQLKTKIAIRHARELTSNSQLDGIAEDVVTRSAAKYLRDCDYIFLAADSMRARLVVNALAHQYLIPVTQLGAKVRKGVGDTVADAMAAVRQIRPSGGCLWCNGFIDPMQLAIEAKSDAERKKQAYGLEEPNPSVITLNAIAAAHAVNEFLFDFLNLRENESDSAYRHYHFINDSINNVVPRRDATCPECVQRLALGDTIELPVTLT